MTDLESKKNLFVCYVPGLDLRRVNMEDTPYLKELFKSYPFVKVKSFPNTDITPTLLTGVYPHEHGIWQVRLRGRPDSSSKSWLASLPNFVSTTLQCILHFLNHSFDLATIPRGRLRFFEITRFKNTRQYFPSFSELCSRLLPGRGFKINDLERWNENLLTINGLESIFGIVGKENSRYVFNRNFGELSELLERCFLGEYRLEWLELHSLDIIEHWNLDDEHRMGLFYRQVDEFIRKLHLRCQYREICLVLLSDHGQEEVKGTIDLMQELRKIDISEHEYLFYLEPPMARFWFFTNRARQKVREMLSSLEHGVTLFYKDLHQYNVCFQDDSYGEVYFIVDPGYIIFPHDFYQPLANLFLGLMDWQQRRRILNPRQRGIHGHLPHHESEKGFMMALDHHYRSGTRPGEEVDVIDVAPSLLRILGYPKPDYMKGRCVFQGDQPKHLSEALV